jgi:hypothetical protein
MTMTTIHSPETTVQDSTPHPTKWWAVLSVVLLLVGLGVGVLVGRAIAPEQEQPANLASSELTGFLDLQAKAVNSGDATRIAEFYAEDATLTDIGNIYAKPLKGRDQIAKVMADNVALLGDNFPKDIGTPIARGNFVTYVSTWGDVAAGVIVFELDGEGKILNQWVIHPAQ